jgi:siderophore synthetase component
MQTETTHIWDIDYIKATPAHEGKENVVRAVAWKVVATDGTHNAQIQGVIEIPVGELNSFTEYSQLTKVQVLGWVASAMGEYQAQVFQNAVAKQLEDIINPPTVSPALPWVVSEATVQDVTIDEGN